MSRRHLWKELLTPSIGGTALYIALSSAVLIGSTFTPLLYHFTTPDNRFYFDELIRQYTSAMVTSFSQSALIGRITVALVWCGVGAAVYVLGWLLVNVYVIARNDIVIGTMFTSVDQRGHTTFWVELTARAAFRLSAIVLILLVAALTVQVWYPVSATMFSVWANGLGSPFGWALAFEAFWGWFILLHTGAVLLRLMLLRTRVWNPAIR